MSNQTKAAGGLSDPGRIKEVLSRHGFHFSKALGQNFLINPTVCPRMAQACGAGDCKGVIEVGPGIGVLTWELSQVAEKVCAIELDSRLFPVLEETLAGRDNVKIIPGDVMKLDLAQLIQEEFGGGPVCVCANLPYYITSPVILRLLEEHLPLTSITVMVQKEAAARLCAAPGSKECGAVSVAVHYRSKPQVLFPVGRGSFMPPPKVDSAVLRLDQGIARGQLHAAVGSLSGTALSHAQQGCPQQQTRAQQHRAGKFRFSPRHQRPPFVFFSLSHSAWRRHRREEKSM